MHRKMAVILAFSGILACCGSLSATERGLRSKGKEQLLGSFYEKTWAVFIGIDDYANLSYDRQLQQAVRDAQGVEKLLREHFRVDEIITLYNQQATKRDIERVLLGTLSKAGKDDGVFVFFAGHGNTISPIDGDLGYLVPHDGSLEEGKHYQNISMTTLKNDVAKAVPAKHIFFVMDACYSGLLLAQRGPGDSAPKADRLDYLQEITRERVRQVLSAGGKGQTVLDDGREGHSVFTGRFLQTLEEADGYITAKEIGFTVPEKVFIDAQDRGHKQQPQFGRLAGQGDFVFVRKDAGSGRSNTALPPKSIAPVAPPPPPPAIVYGHLQVNVNVAGSKVYVDNSYRGQASPGNPLNLKDLGTGTVAVKVEADGYQTAVHQATLSINQWTQLVVELTAVPPPSPPPQKQQPQPEKKPKKKADERDYGQPPAF